MFYSRCGKHHHWHYISSFQVVNHSFILYQHILFMLVHDGVYIRSFSADKNITILQRWWKVFCFYKFFLHKFSKRICLRQGEKLFKYYDRHRQSDDFFFLFIYIMPRQCVSYTRIWAFNNLQNYIKANKLLYYNRGSWNFFK